MTEISLHGPLPFSESARKHPNPDNRPLGANRLPVLFSQAGGVPLPRTNRPSSETVIPAGVHPDKIFGKREP